LVDFGNEFSGFCQYTSSRSAIMKGKVRLEIARPAPKQHSNAAMNAAILHNKRLRAEFRAKKNLTNYKN